MNDIDKKIDLFIDGVNELMEKYEPDGLLFLASFDRPDSVKAAEAGIVRFDDVEHLKQSLYELMLRNPVLKDAVSMIVAEAKVVTIGEPAINLIQSEIKSTPKERAKN